MFLAFVGTADRKWVCGRGFLSFFEPKKPMVLSGFVEMGARKGVCSHGFLRFFLLMKNPLLWRNKEDGERGWERRGGREPVSQSLRSWGCV